MFLLQNSSASWSDVQKSLTITLWSEVLRHNTHYFTIT